jgi:tetratricopeptide (TPR) repeat protein
MALDAYSPCPCGSGKKFKWCCQPIHVQIDKAFRQETEGQHESALRIMDEVVADNPANPEAWGRRAQLLYQNNRVDEAESTLQKALEINPNYPFGHFLRGIFRQNEGEFAGALTLFRRAAQLYDPEARDYLGQIYSLIAESELKLNRPVAGLAALKLAIHYRPAEEDLRRLLEQLSGDKSIFPSTARRERTFLRPSAGISDAARRRWDAALTETTTGKLADVAVAFESLARDEPENAAAWYNLGLCRAWLGDNASALEALDRYVTLEADATQAAAAWALAEVLRSGHGMDAQSDHIEHSVLYQMHNPGEILHVLDRWGKEGRLVGVHASEEDGVITGLLLERMPDLTPALRATQAPQMAAHLLVVADRLRLWHTNAEALQRIRAEFEQAVGPAVSDGRNEQRPASFADILAEALVFPLHASDEADAKRRVSEHVQRYFEETWIHRPLRSLNLIPPIDAAGHAVLRKKLEGVLEFLEDCAKNNQAIDYDFSRLRRKLGLLPGARETAQGLDIGSMSAADLSALTAESLDDDSLEAAYQAALKLDARDVAGRFARLLVARPARPDRPDQYPWYSHLIQLAMGEGDTEAALDYLNQGLKADCEGNAGRRRNDYELRRGQLHAKRGEVDEAQGAFERLIERAPSELRYRGSAAETMLGLKQPTRALRFAEQGLAKAVEKNDRDSEEYFKELVNAARKQGGG